MASCKMALLLLVINSGAFVGGSRRFLTDFLQEWPTPGTGPYFDTTVQSNITGLVGKTVHLICKVKNLGNRTVSWVRHRDIHLLTVGRYTYTSDQRFEAMHSPHAEEWTLRIRFAQRKDSGIYECQISTTPPMGHPVYLNVVEPVTEIIGGPDLFINKGSTINLTCLVRYAPEPPPSMTWSHNRDVINFDSPRGGISLVTEKGVLTSSRLLVQKAIQSDSGLYTCAPSNANPASVRVHILSVSYVSGEHPAAMHHGRASNFNQPNMILLLLTTILIYMYHSIRWRKYNNNNNNIIKNHTQVKQYKNLTTMLQHYAKTESINTTIKQINNNNKNFYKNQQNDDNRRQLIYQKHKTTYSDFIII